MVEGLWAPALPAQERLAAALGHFGTALTAVRSPQLGLSGLRPGHQLQLECALLLLLVQQLAASLHRCCGSQSISSQFITLRLQLVAMSEPKSDSRLLHVISAYGNLLPMTLECSAHSHTFMQI